MYKFHRRISGSSVFYTSEGFVFGRDCIWEEFVLRVFIFVVFCQGIELGGVYSVSVVSM